MIWETNSSAKLGELTINMSGYAMESKYFVLPITNNMTVHALSGMLTITQSTVLLPGAEFIIDKPATLQINAKDPQNNAMGLYLYDQAQWNTKAVPIMYSPSWTNGTCPRSAKYQDMKDAAIYVKGKIEVNGAIYTTAGGAAIYSDDTNAGTIDFKADAASDGNIYKTYQSSSAVAVTSAKLRNGGKEGGSFTATKGVAESGDTYAYSNFDGSGFKWTNLKKVDDCTIQDKTTSVYYAKPQGYVAITSATEDENHLFHSVSGDRLFIQQTTESGCQWWEVTATATAGVYHCATNDTYYEYKAGEWTEVVRSVTFYFTDPKNDASDKKKVLEVNYMARPDARIVTNPTKAADAQATYQFSGWKSSRTQNVYAYTAELEPAELDMYYLPVFDEIPKSYTITLNDAKNGSAVKIEVPYGQVPSYEATKNATYQYEYTFDRWNPTLEAVTGDTSYTALWTPSDRYYTITWSNEGTPVEIDENQKHDVATSYNSAVPSKAADDEFAYTFSGWKSSLDGVTYANGSTPVVKGETTYEAQYATTPRYAITFNNYDGTELQKEVVTEGVRPIYNGLTPTRPRDGDGYYKFIGWKNTAGTPYAKDANLPTATGKETYTAQYEYVTDLFTITLHNVDGNGTTWSDKFGVGSTPFYNKEYDDVPVTPSKTGDAQYEYVFDGWATSVTGAKVYNPNNLPAVEGVAEYWAVFTKNACTYTITYNLNDGSHTYMGYTPATSYTFGVGAQLPPVANMYREGYSFGGWFANSGLTGSAVTAVSTSETGNKEFWAKWTENLHTVGVAYKCGSTTIQTPNGSVTEVGIATTKNVSAPDITGYSFEEWTLQSGVTSSSNLRNTQIAINATADNVVITANYNLIDYLITHNPTDNGSYTIQVDNGAINNGNTYANMNQVVKLVATPANEGYRLGAWNVTAGGNPVEVTNNQFTMPAANVTISPTFVKISTLTIGVNNVEYGSVSHSVVANVPFESSVTVNNNTFTVNGTTVTATPTANTAQYTYEFDHWENLPNNVVADVSNIQAVFTRTVNKYDITWVDGNGATLKTEQVEYGQTPAYTGETPTKTATAQYTYTFNNTWSPALASVTGDATYTAQFDEILQVYTVTLHTNSGTINEGNITNYTYGTGATLPTNVTRSGHTFGGWFDNSGLTGSAVTTISTTATGAKEYWAKWTAVMDVLDVKTPITIDFDATVTTTIVHAGGKLNVSEGKKLTTTTLILEASENASGQIVDEGTITTANAYFHLSHKGGFKARTWYAVAVPWEVVVPYSEAGSYGGVYLKIGDKYVRQQLGKTYDLIYYDGERRAGGAVKAWNYVEDDQKEHGTHEVMEPGRAYMIYLTSDADTIRFARHDGSSLHTNSLYVNKHKSSISTTYADWNGIANPATYHAYLNVGATEDIGQIYETETKQYKQFNMHDSMLVVGQPIFVQPAAAGTVLANSGSYSLSAPRRRAKELTSLTRYVLLFAASEADVADRVIVRMDEDKEEDAYIVGQDLVKMGVSDIVPQMWINRYDSKMCVNTVAGFDNTADYPLGIFAPKDGEYDLFIEDQPDNESMLYLTYDGAAIWNLSFGGYVANLNKGTNTHYGLRIVRKAPQITTGFDEAVVDAKGETHKVVINDQVYIIRNGEIYSVTGQKAK